MFYSRNRLDFKFGLTHSAPISPQGETSANRSTRRLSTGSVEPVGRMLGALGWSVQGRSGSTLSDSKGFLLSRRVDRGSISINNPLETEKIMDWKEAHSWQIQRRWF